MTNEGIFVEAHIYRLMSDSEKKASSAFTTVTKYFLGRIKVFIIKC
jgi:hypothetical protein